MGNKVIVQSDVFGQDAFEIEEGLIDRNLEKLDWISSSTEEFVPIIYWKGHLRRYKYESLSSKGDD